MIPRKDYETLITEVKFWEWREENSATVAYTYTETKALLLNKADNFQISSTSWIEAVGERETWNNQREWEYHRETESES